MTSAKIRLHCPWERISWFVVASETKASLQNRNLRLIKCFPTPPCWSRCVKLAKFAFAWSARKVLYKRWEWKIYCCISRSRQNLKYESFTSSFKLVGYVNKLHQKACSTRSTIIFPQSTNQIIDFWPCRCNCCHRFLNFLIRAEPSEPLSYAGIISPVGVWGVETLRVWLVYHGSET